MSDKNVYMIGGANGSGKTTSAMKLLPDFLSINEFVNADNIAAGLSPFNPDSMAVTAGKFMINRMNKLIKNNESFAFETTCAGKSHARTITKCKNAGYNTHLVFLWLPSDEMAVRRVQNRVAEGGHNIPEKTIRRRYKLGLQNLLQLYIPLFDNVTVYDNSEYLCNRFEDDIIAKKVQQNEIKIFSENKWNKIIEDCNG